MHALPFTQSHRHNKDACRRQVLVHGQVPQGRDAPEQAAPRTSCVSCTMHMGLRRGDGHGRKETTVDKESKYIVERGATLGRLKYRIT